MGINDLLGFDFMDPPPVATLISAMQVGVCGWKGGVYVCSVGVGGLKSFIRGGFGCLACVAWGWGFMKSSHSCHAIRTHANQNLYTLGALDEEGLLTRLGRKMAEFPLEPQVCLLGSGTVGWLGCVWWQWGCGVCWGAVGVSWGWDVWVGCVGGGCLVTGVVVD